MQVHTTRFGTIEADDQAVITFTQPIIGFPTHRRFVLVPGPPDSVLQWLQSTDAPELAFLLMDPRTVYAGYDIDLRSEELIELAASDAADLDVYTLVVAPQDPSQVRTNLKAPVVVNPRARLAKQVVLERRDYPIQYFLGRASEPEPVAGKAPEHTASSTAGGGQACSS